MRRKLRGIDRKKEEAAMSRAGHPRATSATSYQRYADNTTFTGQCPIEIFHSTEGLYVSG
jgi:hypothetical protein